VAGIDGKSGEYAQARKGRKTEICLDCRRCDPPWGWRRLCRGDTSPNCLAPGPQHDGERYPMPKMLRTGGRFGATSSAERSLQHTSAS
jgi:hypothetical protein